MSGDFFDGKKWSKGTPPATSDDACITVAGSYTVTMANGSTVNSLTVGGGATLLMTATCSTNAVLTAPGGLTVQSSGHAEMTATACANFVDIQAPMANAGTLTVSLGTGGSRFLRGNLTNTGTVNLNAVTTYDASGVTWLNQHIVNLGTNQTLTMNGGSQTFNNTGGSFNLADDAFLNGNSLTFTNGAGGSVVLNGAAHMALANGIFNHTGTIGGTSTQPIVLLNTNLNINSGNPLNVDFQGNASETGSIVSGQTVTLDATCAANVFFNPTADLTVSGILTLTSSSCANFVVITMPASGTLTTRNTLTVNPGTGGMRFMRGHLTNTGTVNLNTSLNFDRSVAIWTNQHIVNLAANQTLTMNGGGQAFNNTGGTLNLADNAFLDGSSLTFTNGAGGSVILTGAAHMSVVNGIFNHTGTIGGTSTQPILLLNTNLNINSGNPVDVDFQGSASETGNIVSGQTVTLDATCAADAFFNPTTDLTVSGILTLTSSSCANFVVITMPASGTLTTGATFTVNPGTGGMRFMRGNLTNTGTDNLNTSLNFDRSGAIWTNQHIVNLGANQTLTMNGGGQTFNNNGGTLNLADNAFLNANGLTFSSGTGGSVAPNGAGHLAFANGTFNHTGTIGGTSGLPIVLVNTNLNLSSAGRGSFDWQGSANLSGNLSSAQTLFVDSTCAAHAFVNPVTSFTNAGVIRMTASSCANISQITMPGRQLTNTGFLLIRPGTGGTRNIQGTLVNQKFVQVPSSMTLHVIGATFQQQSAGTFNTLIDAAGNRGQLIADGAVTLGGTLAINRDPAFVPTTGTFPVIDGGAPRVGAFTKETGDVIAGNRYFLPAYTTTGVGIRVTTALMSLSPTSGPRLTVVTVSGSSYPPSDSVSLSFTDAANVTTTFAPATTTSSGTFTTTVTIPTGAALGAGHVSATSTFSGVNVMDTFTVT